MRRTEPRRQRLAAAQEPDFWYNIELPPNDLGPAAAMTGTGLHATRYLAQVERATRVKRAA